MAQAKLVDRTILGMLAPVACVLTGTLAIAVIGGCANPLEDTYGKGVEGGERAIDKAKDTQDKVDESSRQLQEQQKALEGSP
ncbi:MAG TPA: hypothetical protein V6D03_08000 [Candidatus Caenarcaniphilales bacterium]